MKDADSRQELLLRFLDANLRPEEEAQLAELLRSDPEARAFLREVAEQAAMVSDAGRVEHGRHGELGTRRDWSGDRCISPSRTKSMSSVFSRWSWVAAAAVIMLLLVGVFYLLTRSQAEIARVVDLNGSLQWTGDGGRLVRDIEVGKSLEAGMMETLSPDAWIELEFQDGSRMTLSGQSAVTLAAPEQGGLYVRQGIMSANVNPQPNGNPLLIHTPTAMLEVLGTQLNVEAAPSSTHLYVNEGTVRVTRLVDGSVAEVPAEHHIVASLNRKKELKPMRRRAPVYSWKSRLQDGPEAVRGKWLPPSDDIGARLRAVPMVLIDTWTKLKALVKAGKMTAQEAKARMVAIKKKVAADDPSTMYLAFFSVSTGESPPVILQAGSRFRICGRTEFARDVHFGITAHFPRGGFAGKYEVVKPAGMFDDPKGWFDIELCVQDFRSLQTRLVSLPDGMELKDFWAYTVDEQAGLEITEVELLAPER